MAQDFDLYDVLLVIGLALLGVAIWMMLGLAAAIGYVGAVMVSVSLVMAWRDSRGG